MSVVLLAVGVAGAVGRPWRSPAWLIPLAAALLAVALRLPDDVGEQLRPLAAPVGFLLAAVPLSMLLDGLGFFAAAAARLGRGRHLVGGLWILGAVVTTVLNLDAAVVLLTPLYVRIARRHGLDPVVLAFQPVLLSALASSALPVSNLTNLIASSSAHLDVSEFVGHLALPSLAATIAGWFAYRRAFGHADVVAPAGGGEHAGRDDGRALAVGGSVVAAVLVGFVVGPSLGVPEWAVALAADLVLVAVTRRLPVRDLPWDTALVALSLGLLATTAAAHVGLDRLLDGTSSLDLVRITAVAALGANLVNNLPALLVALPDVQGDGVWALLLGVNIGPLVLVTGTLATLLWQASLRRLDVRVTARQFASVGARVVLPSLTAATATLLLLVHLG